jgi:hypothetical protein
MSRLVISEKTRSLVARMFPLTEHETVVDLLETRCGAELPLMSGDMSPLLERIRFAVLKLADGSLPALKRALALATSDWRDVLVAAGFADSLSAHEIWFNERTSG